MLILSNLSRGGCGNVNSFIGGMGNFTIYTYPIDDSLYIQKLKA
jgi:hypothetical protein